MHIADDDVAAVQLAAAHAAIIDAFASLPVDVLAQMLHEFVGEDLIPAMVDMQARASVCNDCYHAVMERKWVYAELAGQAHIVE